MSEISFKTRPAKIKSKKLPNALDRLGKLPVELDKIGVKVLKQIRRNLSGRYLQKRSGKLHDSWEYVLKRLTNLGYKLSWESDSAYARIHEKGGMTGRGHKARMKKTRYATRALASQGRAIHRVLKNYISKLFT